MENSIQFGDFGIVLLFIVGSVIFVLGGLLMSKILSPDRPNPTKNSTYECGEDPVGNAHIQINMRFYIMALIFLIFDVEIVFFFPWATVFADEAIISTAPAWGWLALIEAGIFAGILFLGLVYVWAKGDLGWVKPEPIIPPKITEIPEDVYAKFNQRQIKLNLERTSRVANGSA